jgi:hypothetical protein
MSGTGRWARDAACLSLLCLLEESSERLVATGNPVLNGHAGADLRLRHGSPSDRIVTRSA